MLLMTFQYAALIAVFAVVYRHILAYEPVLNWWFVFGDKYADKWFYKPVWGCELCISGQIALWTYLINWINSSYSAENWRVLNFLLKVVPVYHFEHYSLLGGLIFITTSIAAAWLTYKGFKHLEESKNI